MGLFGKIFGKKEKEKDKEKKKEDEKAEEVRASSGQVTVKAEPAPKQEPVRNQSSPSIEISMETSVEPQKAQALEETSEEQEESQAVVKPQASSVKCGGCNRELQVPLVGYAAKIVCPFCATENHYDP